VLIRPKNWERHGLKPWIEAARKRLHHNVMAIALANKLARIAWSVRPAAEGSSRHLRSPPERSERAVPVPAEVCESVKTRKGSVFPAPANPGDPNGPTRSVR
jgi:hypothetical protein